MALFYVIGNDNMTSWSADKDQAECFTTRKAAEKRARELANMTPGEPFEIVQTVADVVCPVGLAKVTERR